MLKALGEFNLSEEKLEMLERYADLLLKINETTNLTGAKSKEEFEIKHIVDTLAAFKIVKKTDLPCGHFMDVGSGGGIPGIILAITIPEARVTLVERRTKKANLLSDMVTKLGLEARVKVLAKPFEEIRPINSQTLAWFRGFLPGPKLALFLSKNFKAEDLPPFVLMKGPAWEKEKKELLEEKGVDARWAERFERSETIAYELPEKSGSRVLVFV